MSHLFLWTGYIQIQSYKYIQRTLHSMFSSHIFLTDMTNPLHIHRSTPPIETPAQTVASPFLFIYEVSFRPNYFP